MRCKKCKGNMWVEYKHWRATFYEVTCLHCGVRVFVNTKNNAFGRWLRKCQQPEVSRSIKAAASSAS